MPHFPNLFSPFRLQSLDIPNRIFSTGHDTYLPENGLPTEPYIAYQQARAKGGAGLIIIQVVGVHPTARYTNDLMMGTSDDCIPHFRRLVDAVHEHGTKVFVQLFHPGREVLGRPEGVAQAAYAPSLSPSERFRTVPRALTAAEVADIVEGYASTARRMAEAGADGVEIVASHGYLPAQFMNPGVNRRDDHYGGSFDNRLRFTREVAAATRKAVPADFIVGLRFSSDERDQQGIGEDDSLAIARGLKDDFDYFNVIAGTSFAAGGATHIVPSMQTPTGYLAPYAARLKQSIGKPVLVAGRINQPQQAERIIASGGADLCGMTRALIADPADAQQGEEPVAPTISAPASPAIRPASATSSWDCRFPASSIPKPDANSPMASADRHQQESASSWSVAALVASRRRRWQPNAAIRSIFSSAAPSSAARRCWRNCCRGAPSSAASPAISPPRPNGPASAFTAAAR